MAEFAVKLSRQLEVLLSTGPVPLQRLEVSLQHGTVGLKRPERELRSQNGHLFRQAFGVPQVTQLKVNAP